MGLSFKNTITIISSSFLTLGLASLQAKSPFVPAIEVIESDEYLRSAPQPDYGALREQGQEAFEMGQYQTTIDLLRPLQQQYPNDIVLIKILAQSSKALKDYDNTVVDYLKLYELSREGHWLDRAGRLRYRQGQLTDAIQLLKQAEQTKSLSAEGYTKLAKAYHFQGYHHLSEEYAEKASNALALENDEEPDTRRMSQTQEPSSSNSNMHQGNPFVEQKPVEARFKGQLPMSRLLTSKTRRSKVAPGTQRDFHGLISIDKVYSVSRDTPNNPPSVKASSSMPSNTSTPEALPIPPMDQPIMRQIPSNLSEPETLDL